MSTYRLLIVSTESGEQEQVYFLDEDNKDNAQDYCNRDQTVDHDELIEAELPGVFPTESALSNLR